MRSLISSGILVFTSLIALVPNVQAQRPINFEAQGCGAFQREVYYRTEFRDVNICLGETSLLMVVTDGDGLGRERLPVQKQSGGKPSETVYTGISERGTRYSIGRGIFTITLNGQSPLQEAITYASFNPSSISNVRYNCQSQISSFLPRRNVSLLEAEQLQVQRDRALFIYQCTPVSQLVSSASVTGTVTYRQRIVLPSNATVDVRLLDVSRQDAAATTIAAQTIRTEGKQVPIPFTLSYDPAKIQPQHSYAVQARILVDGTLKWISTTRYAVITQGNPVQVEVVVQPVQ